MVSFTNASYALLAAVAMFQGVAEAHGVGVLVKGVLGAVGLKVKARGDTSIWERDDTLKSEFATCMTTLHQSQPKMVFNADNTVDISGLPQICISEINTYNQQPNIAAMNKVQGAAKVTGSNSVQLSGLTPSFVQWLKSDDKH